ncbi:MAG: DNA polymerase III subunit epsilon [Pseudomonadota bacterium]
MKREIILDTETTGLKPEQGHRIIEICGMEVINGIKTGNFFHTFINPQREVPYEAFSIHGISTEFLLDKKIFSEIAHEFLEFIKGSTLVIHNARFDVNFLNHELKTLSHPLISFDTVIDTLAVARKKFPGSPASLDALCKRFKINLSKRDKHGAMIDVELLYEVYKNLVEDRLLIKTNEKTEKNLESLNLKEKKYKEPRKYECSAEELFAHTELLKKIKEPIWNN